MSHYYAGKIAKIPLPPSPPPLPAQTLDDGPLVNGYGVAPTNEYDEEVVADFEKAVYRDYGDVPDAASGSALSQSRDFGKRPASGPVSDGSSDFDVPSRDDKGRHISKKRKTDADIDDLSGALIGEFMSSPGDTTISSAAKGKGKLKLPPADEAVTVKGSTRKKPGPKKRPGAGIESDLASHPPSISDVTPSVSRPSSPVPTAHTGIYELDEAVPPLKKAKKMDDGAIHKRLRALEEAQRKVWTNIARRDVAKVMLFCPEF